MTRVLHAGCGGGSLPSWLTYDEEIRLDINPGVSPDVVAPITALGDVGEFDIVYCAHCLEHLYPHEVGTALAEFRRVLKPRGQAMITVPDLEGIQPTEDVVYQSVADQPITGLDMIFGYRAAVAVNPFMAHHCGFVSATLDTALKGAGFEGVLVKKIPEMFELFGVGVKMTEVSEIKLSTAA